MVNFRVMPTAPCFTAPIATPDGATGVWYVEHWVVWPTREFIVWADGRTTVAPYDFAFRSTRLPSMDYLPEISGVERMTRQTFEERWEAFAQPRLHTLAQTHPMPLPDEAGIHYFDSPYPRRRKVKGSSVGIYYEFVDRLCRRRLEIWSDQESSVGGGASADGSNFLRRARDQADRDYQLREISHLEFETLWEQYGVPALRTLLEQEQ